MELIILKVEFLPAVAGLNLLNNKSLRFQLTIKLNLPYNALKLLINQHYIKQGSI